MRGVGERAEVGSAHALPRAENPARPYRRTQGDLRMKHALRGASTRGLFSVILLIALLVSGCTPNYKVRAFGDAVDQSDRTITVPEGGGLTGVIKDALGVDGWQITIYRGPDVTQGKRWSRWTRFERVRTFTTRYALFLKWSRIVFDRCISSFDPIYVYDISVVDNATDSEVLRVTGHGCEASIADILREALNTPRK